MMREILSRSMVTENLIMIFPNQEIFPKLPKLLEKTFQNLILPTMNSNVKINPVDFSSMDLMMMFKNSKVKIKKPINYKKQNVLR